LDLGFYEQALLILGLAVLAVAALRYLDLPGLLGYLLIGAVFGPQALGLLEDAPAIRLIADFGVVFLLFTIGLEFSWPQIRTMRRTLLGLGLGQVVLTTAGVALIGWLFGLTAAAAFTVGAVLAQSSTSIIVKQLTDQGEQQARHGRLGIGMSVFQDITAIPLVIIIPALGAGALTAVLGALPRALLVGAAVSVALWALGRWLLRPAFHAVARTRSVELLTLASLFTAVAAAWITQAAGLSLALGGFLAGMVLGETRFQHQVEAVIRPFRDVLLGLFFITIGMRFDPAAIAQQGQWMLLLALGSIVFKVALITGLCRLRGLDTYAALRTGLVLAVAGEFGFALLALALEGGVLTADDVQLLLGALFISFVLSTLLIRFNRPLAAAVIHGQTPLPEQKDGDGNDTSPDARMPRDHVVICGYGRVGQNVAQCLTRSGIASIALDLDPDRVDNARLAGNRVLFGDATELRMLEACAIHRARAVVVCFEDLSAGLRVISQVHALVEDLPVLVRTRDERRMQRLYRAGAAEVIPDTLEAGLVLATEVLRVCGIPPQQIRRVAAQARADGYRMLHSFFQSGLGAGLESVEGEPLQRLHTLQVARDSPAVGRQVADLGLESLGLTLVAMVRDGVREQDPDSATRLGPGDVLIIQGSAEQVKGLNDLILAGPAGG